jgi:hypothetical protein
VYTEAWFAARYTTGRRGGIQVQRTTYLGPFNRNETCAAPATLLASTDELRLGRRFSQWVSCFVLCWFEILQERVWRPDSPNRHVHLLWHHPSLWTINLFSTSLNMASPFLLLILCALSAVLALGIPYDVQSPLLPAPRHDQSQDGRVMLAFTEAGRGGEYRVEIPLGVRVSTGSFDKPMIASVAEKAVRSRHTKPPKDNEDSDLGERTRPCSAARTPSQNPVPI